MSRVFKILSNSLSLFALGLATLAVAPGVLSQDTRIRGTVTSVDGKPMEGVTVSVRGESEPYVTTVFTNEQGVYVFPPLGRTTKYSLWAQARVSRRPRRKQPLGSHRGFATQATQGFFEADDWR